MQIGVTLQCAGWAAGPIVLFMFAWITYFCSALLIDAYRFPTVDGPTRNYKYMDAVERYMGEGISGLVLAFSQHGCVQICVQYCSKGGSSALGMVPNTCQANV